MSKALKFIETNTKLIITALLVLVLCLSVLYGVFVRETVVNVVEREETEALIAELVSEIGELEFEYIEEKNTINIDLAYELGFRDISNASYRSRTTAVSLAQ